MKLVLKEYNVVPNVEERDDGGRQKVITIKFDNDDKIYKVIWNTSLAESVNLYNKIKDKLISTIER